MTIIHNSFYFDSVCEIWF